MEVKFFKMNNNETNTNLLTLEELQKLAIELNTEHSLPNNNEIDTILNSLPSIEETTNIDLIQLHTGEYVTLDLNIYVLLESHLYGENIYADLQKVIFSTDLDNYILKIDSIEIYHCFEDYENEYNDYTHSNYYYNFVRFYIEEEIILINKNSTLPEDFVFDKENNYYKKIEVSTDYSNLPYYNDLVNNLNQFYPEKWDFKRVKNFKFLEFNSEINASYLLLIYFENIKITNSQNNVHDINDLYVVLGFNSIGVCTNLYGTRSLKSNVEQYYRYSHSHLPTGQIGYPKKFCTGSGEMSIVMGNLGKEFTDVNFKIFLALLKPYLSWESLEGVPYIRMSNLSGKSFVTENNAVSYNDLGVNNLIEKNIDKLKIIYSNTKGFFEVTFENIENLFEENDLKDFPYVYKDTFTLKYFKTEEIEKISNYSPRNIFVFQGNQIQSKVINKEINKDNLIKTVHPYVTEQTRIYIEKRINEYYFSKTSN